MLYRAWTSMESIMGQDIWTISRRMGMVPILFSISAKAIFLS